VQGMRTEQTTETVDILTVLDDMNSDNAIISLAARDYYIMHYATDTEKTEFVKEDRWTAFLGFLFIGFIIAGIICAFIK
jgi:hypothetical protein